MSDDLKNVKEDILSFGEREIEVAKELSSGASYETIDQVSKVLHFLDGEDFSGRSSKSLVSILKMVERLLQSLPLTAIYNEKDDWEEVDPGVLWRHKRRPSLLKMRDGEISTFKDTDIADCIDIDRPGRTLYEPLVNDIVNEKYPVVFPYFPSARFKVYVSVSLKSRENGLMDDCMVIAKEMNVLKILHPSGFLENVNRRFLFNAEAGTWSEVPFA